MKFLLKEMEATIPVKSDIEPYYHWEDVRDYYNGILDRLPVIQSFSMERKVKYFKVK